MPPPNTQIALELGSARLLVAEDDALSRTLTTTVLERHGYEVKAVADGDSVVPALEEHAIDLLLLDVGLPRLDGVEATRRLRAHPLYTALPILMLTGRGAERDIVTGLDAGADDYLLKPITPGVLLARVRSVLRSRRALRGMEAAHGVVAALAHAINAKDMATEAHSRRLSTHAAAIGRHIGLPPIEIQAVTYGALLHDVGKIGVPDPVLRKPGPLDEDEWELMRRHAEIGERIASPLVGSTRFGPIIRHHHERWDGRGYPDGLRGEDIPIGARIISVADTFDAITHARLYRPARPVEVALDVLRHERGLQFDPDIADAFLEIAEWVGLPDATHPAATVAAAVPRQPDN